jgi:hypothetical protein
MVHAMVRVEARVANHSVGYHLSAELVPPSFRGSIVKKESMIASLAMIVATSYTSMSNIKAE